jgi:glycosyltransferase involved in cell wall biosynthesis
LPAKWIRRRPLVITIRGVDLKGRRSVLASLLGRGAEALTTVNEHWAKEIGRKVGRTVFFTPNGVEVADVVLDLRKRFGLDASKVLALYVGALSLTKGADILAEIAKRTEEAGTCVQFLVVGPGRPEEFGLDRLANVLCIGRLPPQEVLALYGGCDLFVLPSRHEGRPNALLEAMAAGLPSVAAKLPGVEEVLSEECGIVVALEDAKAFAEAVCRLAADRERRLRMAESARFRIRELCLDWDTSASKYLQIFQEVCSCAGSRVS